jgi:HEAT repeat protein
MDTTIGNLRLTVASLSQAVQSPDLGVRLQAIGSLGCMGRKSKQAVPSLIGALKDQSSSVRKLAALALGEIGSKAATVGLQEALQDQDASVSRSAALALMNIGADAAVAF